MSVGLIAFLGTMVVGAAIYALGVKRGRGLRILGVTVISAPWIALALGALLFALGSD